MENTLQQTIDDNQVNIWKNKYGDIFKYEVDQYTCYFKKPNRMILSAASAVGQSDPFKFGEIIVENCWLGGDEIIKSEDKYFIGLQQELNQLIEVSVGELKKL